MGCFNWLYAGLSVNSEHSFMLTWLYAGLDINTNEAFFCAVIYTIHGLFYLVVCRALCFKFVASFNAVFMLFMGCFINLLGCMQGSIVMLIHSILFCCSLHYAWVVSLSCVQHSS